MTRKFVSVGISLLLLSGCGLLDNPSQPEVPDNVVNYVALGASDTIGWGGSDPCAPFVTCLTGTGYVQRVAQRFQSTGKTVSLINFGVPGAVLSPDVQAMGNSIGLGIERNLLTDESSYPPRDTTLVTVFIGANDVNTIGSLLNAGRGGSDPGGFIQTQIQSFGNDLKTMVSNIRSKTETARIIQLNLPNMGAMPYAAGRSVDERRTLQQIAVGFSAKINALASSGVIVLDLMCDGNFYNPAIFSSDGFHPNDTGYAYLADLVYAAATTGAAPAPKAACSQMTIY
ncbi:MAG TPA: GDSL-type esterase/lipase family protein [Vicinamibacterales bacterium]|jgi:lysophospholipase L1-like esterase|nr:GDSL-type esterase/lipase family protein [Vicinamibacterales bacterium]